MGCRAGDMWSAGLRICGLQGLGHVGCSARDIWAVGLGIYGL